MDALAAFCPGADVEVTVLDIPDGRAPAHWERIKNHLSDFRRSCNPDVVFGPHRGDAHQDHRLLAELLPTEFRDHLLLGYEILKWESDTPQPDDLTTRSKPMWQRRRRACCTSTIRRRRATTGSTSKRFSVCRDFAGCSAAAHTPRPSLWRRRPSHSSGAEGAGGRLGSMRVLVTGHQGYLGTVMVPILQAAGHDVTGLDSGFFADCVLGPAPTDPPGMQVDLRDVTATRSGGIRRRHPSRCVVQ